MTTIIVTVLCSLIGPTDKVGLLASSALAQVDNLCTLRRVEFKF